jgi:hypothetical protein
MEKAESSPRENKVKAKMKIHTLGAGKLSIAVGKATKARPLELVLLATTEPKPWRYPTVLKTAKPQKNEKEQLPMATRRALLMIGWSTLL